MRNAYAVHAEYAGDAAETADYVNDGKNWPPGEGTWGGVWVRGVLKCLRASTFQNKISSKEIICGNSFRPQGSLKRGHVDLWIIKRGSGNGSETEVGRSPREGE